MTELIGFTLEKKRRFPAGQGFRYTDVDYLVLGLVIEAASGRNYYDLLQARTLDPEGLSGIRPQNEAALPGITPGYTGGVRNLREDGFGLFVNEQQNTFGHAGK